MKLSATVNHSSSTMLTSQINPYIALLYSLFVLRGMSKVISKINDTDFYICCKNDYLLQMVDNKKRNTYIG